MHHLALVLTLAVTSHALVLQKNYREPISLGRTKNVELVCKPRDDAEIAGHMKNLMKIVITKLHGFGESQKVAELCKAKPTIDKFDDDIIASGEIDGDKGIFLKVKWPVANEDTPGAYGCQISGLGLNNDSITVSSDLERIEGKPMTVTDVDMLISEATLEFRKHLKALEQENARLRNYIDFELQETRQQNKDSIERCESEISVLKDETVKKFTVLSELFHSKFAELPSELFDFKWDIDSTFASIFGEHSFFTSQTNNELQKLSDGLRSLKHKFKYLFAKIFKDHPQQEPIDVTTPPPPIAVQPPSVPEWPAGDYGLVRTQSAVCPSLASPRLSSPGEDFKDFVNINVITLTGKFDLTNCWQTASLWGSPATSYEWPRGSYCIARGQKACPKDFSDASITYTIDRKFHVTNFFFFGSDTTSKASYQAAYCCRSDGAPCAAIKLPTDRAFYLYRYQRVCQKIEGMTLREDFIDVEKIDIQSHMTTTKGSIHPDVLGEHRIRLCYYEPNPV